jgi:hypothetical protein
LTFESAERVLTSDVPLPWTRAHEQVHTSRPADRRSGLAPQHEMLRIAEAPSRAGGLLQRACSCGGTPGPEGLCAECQEEQAYAMSGTPDEEYSDLDVHLSQNPGDLEAPADVGAAEPEPAATSCPTSIKVAEIVPVPLTAAQIGKGVRSGWGAITRMEVSGGSKKDWDGTRVKEVLSTGTNDCDKSPACANTSAQAGNAGSTWTVGSGSPAHNTTKLGEVIPEQPAKKNSFWDIHVQGGGVNWCAENGSCSRSCTQHFECGGKAFGSKFTVSWSYATASRKDPDGASVSVCAGTLTKGPEKEGK